MMAFVINNSPRQKSKMKKNEVVPEPPSYLVLMPFQPPAKVFFEHIKMGQEAVRILKIRNPSDNPINVVLDKLPDPKIGLTLSDTEFIVEKNSEYVIQITFKPLLEGSARECIHVRDANKNKKVSDIFINWDSVNPNPPKLKKKKPLVLETKILTQNKVIGKKAHVKTSNAPSKPLWKSSYGYPTAQSAVPKSMVSYKSGDDLPPCDVPGTPTRRQTYIVEDKENLDTNCGIYSTQHKRSPRLGKNTVLSPLPLLTKGRLRTRSQNKEDNLDRHSIALDPKVKKVQSIRNLQLSEDILHLGPSDDSDDDVVCLGNKTYRKHGGHPRRDTYLVDQTYNVKQNLPSQDNYQDRRNTYHVEFSNETHNLIPEAEFTGNMFIEEEEIRETTITRTPFCKRNSFGKRGSWGEASLDDSRRKSIEMVDGKLRIKKSSMGKLYNEYRRRSIDRFSIDSLEAMEDVDAKTNPVEGDIFEDINFDIESVASPMELPEYFNPRRTSTDLKQKIVSLKHSKQSKKNLEFISEPAENIGEKAKNAFDESINSLKSATNDLFESMFASIKGFDDVGNMSGVSSIKSSEVGVNGTYLLEGKRDQIKVEQNVDKKLSPSKTFGNTCMMEKVPHDPLSSETFNKSEQGATFIKEKAIGETFQVSCNARDEGNRNVTYCVPRIEISEHSVFDQGISQPNDNMFLKDKLSTTRIVSTPAVDVPDHSSRVIQNPLKSLNEKISSIEFAVSLAEQKRAEIAKGFEAEIDGIPRDMHLSSIPEFNESKQLEATTSASDETPSASPKQSATAPISPNLLNTTTSTIASESNKDGTSSKPTSIWTIDISPPSKLVEEKKQPGKYDFLIKYQQTRQVTRSISRPSTRILTSSTPKPTPKTGSDKTGQEIKTIDSTALSSSNDFSTSSSDRSKSSMDSETGSSMRSSSRKRRSSSSVGSGGDKKQGPPGKLFRTSSQLDVFKKPAPKPVPAKAPTIRKTAGLPMKSLHLNKKRKPREESVQFYNPEKVISDYTDSNLLIATGDKSTPFSVGSLYMDPKVLDDLERDNIKWLNSLLTPPIELECDAEGLWCVDIADLWLKSSQKQNIELAPSREKTAMKYHGQQDRLDALRKAAFQLFRSPSMSPVLSKLSWHISKNLIEVRKDRDLHLDQGIQQKVISLLVCYNPLWLRIGLEAVYGCTVPLHSNNDVVGLTSFMRKHLVNDPYTRKQHAHPKVPNLMDATFADAMKKFVLRKFLMLVYFLDRAKSTKLIRHDPCLFIRKSKYKDSAQLVIEFSRDLISGGDILRHLRTIGYVLEHKQTYLNEFDFSTKSLLDLRDGVRLARAMEIILHQKYLTKRLRAPAISRLQKVHNVEISISALQDAGYDIQDDISAKDIADGHREKILSLLWQIIYKFQAPRFDKAARTIQNWYNSKSLFIVIRRRIRVKLQARQNAAATALQSRWKGILIRRKFIQLKNFLQEQKKKRQTSATIIQSNVRRYLARTRYLKLRTTALKLQRNYRHRKVVNTDREDFVRLRQACVTIQRFYRNYKINQTYKNRFEKVRAASATIQRWFRNVRQMRVDRKQFVNLRRAVVNVQNRFRANKLTKNARRDFVEMKKCAITLQIKYRAISAMKTQRKQYVELRNAAVKIQELFRAKIEARKQRTEFLNLKRAALVIQSRYRAKKCMQIEREKFIKAKQAALTIQNHFRLYQLMKTERTRFLELKSNVLFVQRRYRANKLMTVVRDRYKQIIESTLCIQRRCRANVDMKVARAEYVTLRQAAVLFQQKYRAQRAMQAQRTEYIHLKSACLTIQHRFRDYLLMQHCRQQYLRLRNTTVFIQTLWRAKLAMRRDREAFLRVRHNTVMIQRYFRGYLKMKKQREEYARLRSSAVKIQEWYRRTGLANQMRRDYLAKKQAVVVLQTRYRALVIMRAEKSKYIELRTKTILLQGHFRAYLSMKQERNHYNRLRKFTVLIQRNFRAKKRHASAAKIQNYFRGYLLMLKQREQYLTLRRCVISVQTIYRATLLMREKRDAYAKIRVAAVSLQQRWRATSAMKKQRQQYLVMKQSAIVIQQWYRNIKLARLEAQRLAELKSSALCIQRWYRATQAMRKRRGEYLSLRNATIMIQVRFRSHLITRNLHEEYLELKCAVLKVQRRFRAQREMKSQRNAYTTLKQATLTIQTHYRGYVLMKMERQSFLALKQAMRTVESRIVANRMMRIEREHYLNLKRAVHIVEDRYRARLAMKKNRGQYLAMKSAAVKISHWYLGKRATLVERHNFLEFRFFTVMIQRRYRFKLNLRKYERVIELLKRKKEEERLEKYRHQCATKIQSVWKMYQSRKQFGPIIEQKKKERKTTENQFENQAPLYVRLEEAISGLSVGTDLFCVIKSLYNIDTVTTLSPKLCVGFTNKGLVPMLYQYLQSANRSEPNKIMCIGILRVFINLARFDLTAPILWKITLMVDGLNTIVDLIKIWYDKNDELMCAATTLLWLFSKVPANIEIINNTENLTKKLLYVFKQLDNKKKPRSKGSDPLVLPGAKADWGLGYRRKVFTDPLYAATTLCRKLGLLGNSATDMSRISVASTSSGVSSRLLRSAKITKHSL